MSRRLLVISHPCVVAENQLPYVALRADWTLDIMRPATWPSEYGGEIGTVTAELADNVHDVRALLAGRSQRWVCCVPPAWLLRRFNPDVVFLEAEPFSLLAAQWYPALNRRNIPFGVQCAENLDRPMPSISRWTRSRVLRSASFVAARSNAALKRALEWGATGAVRFVPHAVPDWAVPARKEGRPFTVGYAGRLVHEKGVDVLASALAGMRETRLLAVGAGPLENLLFSLPPACGVEVRAGVGHAQMPSVYAEMDVLVLPSITTPTWKEQFGRVLVEALWCGVPVIGSDSGEIPWVIETTGGGVVVPEGDADALRVAIDELRSDAKKRQGFADAGRLAVASRFSVATASRELRGLLDAACPSQTHQRP